MSPSPSCPLVSTEWLAAHLDAPNLVTLDGSFKPPSVTPVAADDFTARHDLAIYDDAWTGRGKPGDRPVETGPGKGRGGR